ncbi:microfibrillar-associated protein [Culex quinquefasciatus]|uniref:Microfibrillar-associated protein n=1 Tax=Culex quinquefasciatus TaxID=7176 RepID=B0XKZ7_CULQU|nr:microfibrillar-associated protein [Culex quinquefasciatus]|eukprot:XP_001870319.1 microfibrillar-associated protein [Culex quinquefasciatus]
MSSMSSVCRTFVVLSTNRYRNASVREDCESQGDYCQELVILPAPITTWLFETILHALQPSGRFEGGANRACCTAERCPLTRSLRRPQAIRCAEDLTSGRAVVALRILPPATRPSSSPPAQSLPQESRERSRPKTSQRPAYPSLHDLRHSPARENTRIHLRINTRRVHEAETVLEEGPHPEAGSASSRAGDRRRPCVEHVRGCPVDTSSSSSVASTYRPAIFPPHTHIQNLEVPPKPSKVDENISETLEEVRNEIEILNETVSGIDLEKEISGGENDVTSKIQEEIESTEKRKTEVLDELEKLGNLEHASEMMKTLKFFVSQTVDEQNRMREERIKEEERKLKEMEENMIRKKRLGQLLNDLTEKLKITESNAQANANDKGTNLKGKTKPDSETKSTKTNAHFLLAHFLWRELGERRLG